MLVTVADACWMPDIAEAGPLENACLEAVNNQLAVDSNSGILLYNAISSIQLIASREVCNSHPLWLQCPAAIRPPQVAQPL